MQAAMAKKSTGLFGKTSICHKWVRIMPRKVKTSATRTRPSPKMVNEPTPAERLAALERRATARGYRPMTLEEFDTYVDEHRDIWPEPAEIDAFVSWLHQSRRQGHYS
jgi:hypothetical protein